ncbi:MAG: choice-of-anchor J domain-containing protein [Xanthomonadales bacterium]|nr:choice-of-anchor J domain-containing protein [Xanthomonadales bacterium]
MRVAISRGTSRVHRPSSRKIVQLVLSFALAPPDWRTLRPPTRKEYRMNLKITTSLLAGAIVLALPMMAAAQTGARTAPVGTPDAPAAASPFAPLATITESFDVVPGTDPNQCPTGWICSNVSSPLGTTNWFQGNDVVFPAQAGPTTGYIATNFNNTTGTGDISNWLITPVMQFGNGSELRFWARVNTGSSIFPDRVEIRASTGGSDNGGTAASTGDFSILLGTINPSLSNAAGACAMPAGAPGAGGFPETWCEYLLTTADGIPNSGSGRIAFRYFVTNGGPTGANSNYIGIDTFSFVEGSAVVPSQPVPAFGDTARWLLLFGVLGLGAFAARRRWA